MRNIILAVAILIVSNVSAQITYFNYLHYSSEWKYYGGGWNGVNSYDSYETVYFDGYETINGVPYYKKYSKRVETHYNPPFGSTYSNTYTNGPFFVREDGNGKFYTYNVETGEEVVIFDSQQIINSEIGDLFPEYGASCNVQEIQTVSLGSMQLKRVNGTNTQSWGGSLEGVGTIGMACGMGIEGNYWLNCYTKQGNNLQFGTADCNTFPIPERTFLDINSNEFANSVKIYPNPSVGNFKVSLPPASNFTYSLYSLSGQLLQKGMVTNESTINIEHLSDGVYVLEVTNDQTHTKIKVIKQ